MVQNTMFDAWTRPSIAAILAVLAVVGGLWLYRAAKRALSVYRVFRGRMVVRCPETQRPAGVAVDAYHAATTAALENERELRLSSCSRWPERRNCGQECLREIEASPEDCLVRTILTRWYLDKSCVLCGKRFGAIHWHDHKPALVGKAGVTREWADLPIETVPDALAADKPVCWDCHIAETFRRKFPEGYVDRPWQGSERHHRML
jgi:hypothetical protein